MRHMMLAATRPSTFPQAHFYGDVSGISDARVRRAIHFMEQKLSEPITIGALAASVNLSARQLERVFGREVGMMPMAYLKALRLRYGSWLLKHTQAPISGIAADCGFTDGPHFAREFKRTSGTTPSAFRRVRRSALSGPETAREAAEPSA